MSFLTTITSHNSNIVLVCTMILRHHHITSLSLFFKQCILPFYSYYIPSFFVFFLATYPQRTSCIARVTLRILCHELKRLIFMKKKLLKGSSFGVIMQVSSLHCIFHETILKKISILIYIEG